MLFWNLDSLTIMFYICLTLVATWTKIVTLFCRDKNTANQNEHRLSESAIESKRRIKLDGSKKLTKILPSLVYLCPIFLKNESGW